MLKWSHLLPLESAVDADLNAIDEYGMALYHPEHGYKPNVGGQALFWKEMGGFSEDNLQERPFRTMALLGGIGSGKSFTGAVWACDRAIKYPNARGLIAANSFPQLAQATLVTLAEVCLRFNVPLDPIRDTPEETALAIINRRPSHCFLGPERAYVYILSTSSFEGNRQTSRGLQARWAWLDEMAYASETAFNTIDGRIGRGPGRELEGSICVTTTPRGFNWLYYRMADPARSDEWKKTFWYVNCPTSENIENLGEDYVNSLTGNYKGDIGKQELEGLFLNTTLGLVYKWFRRSSHSLNGEDATVLSHNPAERIHMCLDFNYSPTIAVLFHVRQSEVHVFKEFYRLDSDLWELMETVCSWLKDTDHCGEVWLHGDASGRSRSATSRLSAWDIVTRTLSSTQLKIECKFPKSNPPVTNRVDSFNWLCRQDRFFIDADNAPQTLRDLETVTWDGTGIGKDDRLATHCSDALTYGTHWMFPFGGSNRMLEVGQERVPGLT